MKTVFACARLAVPPLALAAAVTPFVGGGMGHYGVRKLNAGVKNGASGDRVLWAAR